jgi:hypothetical protein
MEARKRLNYQSKTIIMNILKTIVLAVIAGCLLALALNKALPQKKPVVKPLIFFYFYSSDYYLDKVTDPVIQNYSYWMVNNRVVTHWIRGKEYPEKEVEAMEKAALPLVIHLQLVDTSTEQIAIQKTIQTKY